MATKEETGLDQMATEEDHDSETMEKEKTGLEEERNDDQNSGDALNTTEKESEENAAEPEEIHCEEDDDDNADAQEEDVEPTEQEETDDLDREATDENTDDKDNEAPEADENNSSGEERNEPQQSTDALEDEREHGETKLEERQSEAGPDDEKDVQDVEKSEVDSSNDDKTADSDVNDSDQKSNNKDREAPIAEESDILDSEDEEGGEQDYPEEVDCEEDDRDQEDKGASTPDVLTNGDVDDNTLTPLPLFSSVEDTHPACVIRASTSVLEHLNVSASVERSGEGVRVCTASHLSHLTVGSNEELISDVIRPEPFGKELPSSVIVDVPYTGSPLPRNDHREIAIKVSSDGETWRLVRARHSDIQFEDYKGFFAQLKLHRLCLLAVVLRLKREHFILEPTGGSVKSSVDHRVALEWSSHPERKKKGRLTLEVRPTTTFVHDLKDRDPLGYEWLLTMGPVVYLPVHTFRRAVTVTLPCPHHEAAVSNALPPWRDPAIPTPVQRVSQAPYSQMLLDKVKKREDRKDALHVMMYDRATQRWSLQVNNLSRHEADTEVTFQPTKLADGYMVMRTLREVPGPLEDLTQRVDRVLRETQVCWTLYRHGHDPDRIVVRCATLNTMEQVEDELKNAGFCDISPVSEEVGLLEGQSVIISLGGNLVIDDEDGRVEVAMRFHANQQVVCEFWIKARDRYADRAYPTYRGTLVIHAEEPGGQRRLLCAMAVTLPKMEKRFERATRAKHVDITNDPLNNQLLDWLSFELGKHWETVGKALKQSNATLQRIKRNYPYDNKTQGFNMLYQWRQSQSKSTDKVRELAHALKKSHNRVLADDLIKRCTDRDGTEEPLQTGQEVIQESVGQAKELAAGMVCPKETSSLPPPTPLPSF
ncbi:death domain-containing protein 1-like [Branchiostoma lanceolatum]|uniref:death domain-containing protein 1-like n=1 Tax=Branchiostoma lanceolatum TaxID=7740 RepID=UPI0034516330